MNLIQAKNKLRKLSLLFYARDNIAKIIPSLKYSATEAEAKKELAQFLKGFSFDLTEKDFKYLFSLTLLDLARFTSVSESLQEIALCQEIIETDIQKKGTNKHGCKKGC